MKTLFENSEENQAIEVSAAIPSQLESLVRTSGLPDTKQNEIAATLSTFFEYAATWTKTVDDLKIESPTDTGKMQMARAGRLDLRGKRLEAEKLVDSKRQQVKAAKSAFDLEDTLWLKAGQMMVAQFKHLEVQLEEKEKFAERWEADRRARLKSERLEILAPLGYFDGNGLDTMTDIAFDALKSGLEKAKAEQEEAARKAEAARIAAENAAIEERKRIQAENERLKAEAERKEKELQAEREKAQAERLKAEAERKAAEEKVLRERLEAEAKAKAEREAIELKARQEREAAEKERREAEAKAERERAEAQAKIDAERARVKALEDAAKAKEAAEIAEKARIEAEEKAKQKAAQLAAEKAAKAPKKEKLTAWIDAAKLELPAEFVNDPTAYAICAKFDAFKTWAKQQIEQL